MHIAVICIPLSGHLNPNLLVAKGLIERGHEVTILTGADRKKSVEAIGAKFIDVLNTEENIKTMDKIKDFNRKNFFDVGGTLSSLRHGQTLTLKLYPHVINILEDLKPDAVLLDFVTYPGKIALDQLKVPYYTVSPTPFVTQAEDGIPYYMGLGPMKIKPLEKARNYLGWRLVHLVKKLIYVQDKKEMDAANFKYFDNKGTEVLYSPDGVIAYGLESLEFNDNFNSPMKWVGYPVEDLSAESTLKFNVKWKKKVLVTLGSTMQKRLGTLLTNIGKLAVQHPDILFCVTAGMVNKDNEELESKLDNLKVFTYIDYSSELYQFDAIIQHGGAGIFYHAIYWGIPSVYIPQDNDQFDYSKRGQHFGMGIKSSFKNLGRDFSTLLYNWDDSRLASAKEELRSTDPASDVEEALFKLLDKDNIYG